VNPGVAPGSGKIRTGTGQGVDAYGRKCLRKKKKNAYSSTPKIGGAESK
tara:strand:+ start:560 stop:706 length:147 start_codon:yes stop_codon:yes gene_type:complete